jgi:hypothetical protein
MMDVSDEEPGEELGSSLEDLAKFQLEYNLDETDDLDAENLQHTVTFLHDVWCKIETDMQSLFQRNKIFFGESNEVLERFRSYSRILVRLDKRMGELTKPNPSETLLDQDQTKTISDQLSKISANILYGYESVVQMYRQLYCNKQEFRAMLPPTRMDVFFSPLAETEMKPHQKLIRFYLETCSRRQYRRQGTALLAPLYTEQGEFTRTFTHACEISEFVYEAISPYSQHIWLFSALTSSSGVSKHCQDYLSHCHEDDLPVIRKHRDKFSYKNGLFDARQNTFYTWGEEPLGWSDDAVCANYIDETFEFSRYREALAKRGDPLDIPTPNVQRILDSQNFEPEVCRWFFASVGRMIFDIGDLDGWQYFPFCKGTAGSGKSTLLRLASKFYSNVDAATLMSEGQKTFSTEHLQDKFVFFCYDVDDKMNFSLTRWNQIVSGESISIERKFKTAIEVVWKAAGAFAGNSYPPWVDQAGNVSRRMLIFMFEKMVRHTDPTLFEKCLKEMPAFMKKCVSCYMQLLERFANNGIWDRGVLPDYFHRTRREMQAQTNPLQAFLQSEKCIFGQDEHLSWSDFNAAFKAFCELQRLTKRKLTLDFCNPLFDPMGVTIVVPPKQNELPPGQSFQTHFHGYTTKYILGLSLNH